MVRRISSLSLPILAVCVGLAAGALADPGAGEDESESSVRVAVLTYAGGKTSKCFAAGFLEDVARQTHIKITRTFANVALDSADLFSYPFVILTGEGDFKLSEQEIQNLRAYLQRGGFLLASAGCSSREWTSAFRAAMKAAFPDAALMPIKLEHPIFHTLYDIQPLRSRQVADQSIQIEALESDGRLTVVFSPYGLNDTANAGGNCCCCGGNEIRNAHLINADVLAYALTH